MTQEQPSTILSAIDGPSFTGFPSSAQATAVPSAFFTELLPSLDDADELRLTLYVFYALGRRKGYPSFLTETELLSEAPLLESLSHSGSEPESQLRRAVRKAVERGSLLGVRVAVDEREEFLVTTHTPANRRAFEQIADGRLALGRAVPRRQEPAVSRRDNVFQLYERNVGPITPLIAEELKEAERLYPSDWLEEAMREAAQLNKRSWRYISRILQRWATEGRQDEKAERDLAGDDSAKSQILRRYRQLGGR